MDKELFEEIKQHLDKKLPKFSDNEYVAFPKQDYELIKIEKENFHSLPNSIPEKKITFIDGGNSSLLEAPNFSLQLIRIAGVTYKNKKRLTIERKDVYCLVNSEKCNDDILFKAKIFQDKDKIFQKQEFTFNSMDQTIKKGNHRARIDEINNIIRKFLELEFATLLTDKTDVIVLDNSLQASVTGEQEYFNNLYQKAKQNNTIISGLTKTTHMMTNNGNSVAALLQTLNENTWYYSPLVHSKTNNHQAEIAFLKLHEKAQHVFRFEIYKEQNKSINEVIALLKQQSHDPVFFGYPYGLIQADAFARITNKEKEYVLTKFLARFGNDFKKLKKYMTAIDAHSILDSIG